MREPDDGTTEGPTERLQAGPSRPQLFPSVPAKWRQRAAGPVAFVLGVAASAVALLWWQAGPTPKPPRFHADVHDVELVLFEAAPPRTKPGGRGSEASALQVGGALLLSGSITSTVSNIELLDNSLDVRAPQLPLTVSPSDRFQSINLRISVRDCGRATRWEPADRPFIIAWRDGFDRAHTDRAGDYGRSTGNSLLRYIDAVCDDP